MPSHDQVWIIDDDRSMRWVLEKALSQAGLEVATFSSGDAALRRLGEQQPQVILSDIRMQGVSGLELLAHIRQVFPHVPVIIMTAHSDLDSAVKSYEGGAFEYLPKPFDLDDALALVRRALAEAHQGSATAPAPAPASAALQETGIIGKAPAMRWPLPAAGTMTQ